MSRALLVATLYLLCLSSERISFVIFTTSAYHNSPIAAPPITGTWPRFFGKQGVVCAQVVYIWVTIEPVPSPSFRTLGPSIAGGVGGQGVVWHGFYGGVIADRVLKAIISSRCLSSYRDLFNLRHLVCRWCSATHTFFLSCGKITVTSEDMANQLLFPILGDMDPSNIELSVEEEAMEVELRRRTSGNAKLSH